MCGGMFRRAMIIQPRVETAAPPRPQEAAPPAPAALPVAAAPTVACTLCGQETLAEFSWCPRCGAALHPQPCAFCGQDLQPQDTHCPACGAPRARTSR